jgi:C-terminal processing protease CtpA/Prc
VGGKLEAPEGSDSPSLSGIFIKNVLSGSPAAATNQLNTGDRIIAVGDVDLRYASHDKVPYHSNLIGGSSVGDP